MNEKRTSAKTYGVSNIQSSLRELDLLGKVSNSKFIPSQYKNSSIDDRFSLLQGLFDTDGYVDKAGHVNYYSVSFDLIKDIQWVLHSLGFTATLTTKKPVFVYNGVKKTGQLCYVLYVRGNNQDRLFRLSRKKERTIKRTVFNKIVSIWLLYRNIIIIHFPSYFGDADFSRINLA